METFSMLLAICVGNSPAPTQRPVTRSFDVFFDLRLNKRLSKHCWGWWFGMPSCPLWRHCNMEHHYPDDWPIIIGHVALSPVTTTVSWTPVLSQCLYPKLTCDDIPIHRIIQEFFTHITCYVTDQRVTYVFNLLNKVLRMKIAIMVQWCMLPGGHC